MFKKFIVALLVATAIFSFAVVAYGEDKPSYRSEITGLIGNQSLGQVEYGLGDHFKVEAFSENGVSNLGLGVQPFSWLGLKAGYTYDSHTYDGNTGESFPYAGLNFDLPFGTNNLRVSGFYDYHYAGKDWSRYEAALRIQMYEHVFLYAGVRGDAGDGAPTYTYNQEREALLFLRGQVALTTGKWEWDLKPLLYVNGTLLHDYSMKYHFSDRTSLVLNVNTLYENRDLMYRAGIEYKF